MISESSEPRNEAARPLSLVTGASSGLGEAFADRLAAEGHDLIVVARRKERLQALAERLREVHGTATEVLVADLANSQDLARVESRIAQGPALELLVNNAGFGGYRSFLRTDPSILEQLMSLQVLAVTQLTRAALPAMVDRGRGAVINVSSGLSLSAALPSPPFPSGRATYAATKAFINTFTQLIQGELAGTGVRMQALCPSVIRTEFHSAMGIIEAAHLPGAMDPADVVEASLIGLASGEVLCFPALKNLSLLDELHAVERRILESTRENTLADRYLRT